MGRRVGCHMIFTGHSRLSFALPSAVYFTMLAGFVLGGAQVAKPQAIQEQQVKAAFLYNFAKFVEWPPQTFATASDPFVVCAYGKNPVYDALKQGVEDKTVQNRTISVKAVTTPSDAKACQVLYFDQAATEHLSEMLPALQKAHVLTVGETNDFTKGGGIIGFVVISSQLRFTINNAEAGKSGLSISSRLLSLAKDVKD